MTRLILCVFALIAVAITSIPQACAVGFENLLVPDPADKPLAVGVWYPSNAPVAPFPFGFAFDARGLASVLIPVQLWEAEEDRNVPNPSNTDIVRQSLPTAPDFHLVRGANHYAFLPPCEPELQSTMPQIWAMICVDPPGFDRAAFHREFNKDIVNFFRTRLSAQ
jgi:hypothetical protein